MAKFIARAIETARLAAVCKTGCGKTHSCSAIEGFGLVAARTGNPTKWTEDERAVEGDHTCS
jgi:hypothetical protein